MPAAEPHVLDPQVLDPHPPPDTYVSSPVLIWNAAVTLEPPAAVSVDVACALQTIRNFVSALLPSGAPKATMRCSILILAAAMPPESAAPAKVT